MTDDGFISNVCRCHEFTVFTASFGACNCTIKKIRERRALTLPGTDSLMTRKIFEDHNVNGHGGGVGLSHIFHSSPPVFAALLSFSFLLLY